MLFVPLPNSLSTSGVIQVQDALDAGVLQAIDDYETPDAAAQYFVLGIEAGQEFGVRLSSSLPLRDFATED